MRGHGLKTWKHEDYEVADQILDKYREIDAHNASKPESRSYSRGSSIGSTGNISDNAAKDTYTSDSDIASRRGRSRSDIVSRGASSVGSDICSIPSVRRSRASSHSDIASRGARSDSDDEFSDEDQISANSDYMSSDKGEGSVASRDDGSDADYGEDYMDDGEAGYIEDDVYDDDDDY